MHLSAKYEPLENFTNTTDYKYFESLMQGLNLGDKFASADLCQNAIIGFIDDTTEFQNNITLELYYTTIDELRPIYPVLSFTELIGTDFADIFPYCWETI